MGGLIVLPGPTHEFIPPKNVEDVGSGWSTRDRSTYNQIIIDENTEFRNWKNQAVVTKSPGELKNVPQTHWSNLIITKEKTESSKDKDSLSLNSIDSVSSDIVEPNDTNP